MRELVVLIIICLTISCGQNQKSSKVKFVEGGSKKEQNKDSLYPFILPRNFTPIQFINLLRIKNSKTSNFFFISIVDDFPENWITKKDIDSLIVFIKSKDKCYCFVDPLSSFIPNDYSELGGYIIEMINSYKRKETLSFGLYSCPKLDETNADELIEWWNSVNSR
jgi:hypothetical protein